MSSCSQANGLGVLCYDCQVCKDSPGVVALGDPNPLETQAFGGLGAWDDDVQRKDAAETDIKSGEFRHDITSLVCGHTRWLF